MKWLLVALSVCFLAVTVPAVAVGQGSADLGYSVGISAGQVTPTPDMWFYEQQLQQYLDPKMMVRQKAEFKSAQRRYRIAARKWYGFSNSRPIAGIDPVHGTYSPGWTSGNNLYPFRWGNTGPATVIVVPEPTQRLY